MNFFTMIVLSLSVSILILTIPLMMSSLFMMNQLVKQKNNRRWRNK